MKKELIDDNRKLREENKKLKTLCDKYEEEHRTTFEEWKKTINIINKLEKYLEEQVEKSWDNVYDNVLDKLDELKGSDKSGKF